MRAPLIAATLVAIPLWAGARAASAQPGPAVPPTDTVPAAAPPPVEAPARTDMNAPSGVGTALTADLAAIRAAKTSPEMRRRGAEVAAAYAAAKTIELARIPRASASLTYTRLSPIDPVELAPGVAFPVFLNSTSAKLEVAVPLSDYLFTFPDLLTAARAGAEAAKSAEASTERDVAHAARLAYYEWVRAIEQQAVAEATIQQVKSARVQVAALVEVRRLAEVELLRLDAQLAQAEQLAVQLDGARQIREVQLRAAIGADDAEVLQPADGLVPPEDVPRDADEVQVAMSRRPDVRTLDAGIRARNAQATAERAKRYPKVVAFAQAEVASPNQRIFPQTDEFRGTWAAGLALSWSLNDALGGDATGDTYRHEAAGLAADRDRLRDGVRLQVVAARAQVAAARASIDVSKRAIAAATEVLRLRTELLAAARGTAVEVVDAQSDLVRAQIAEIDARLGLIIAVTELRHALGLTQGAQ